MIGVRRLFGKSVRPFLERSRLNAVRKEALPEPAVQPAAQKQELFYHKFDERLGKVVQVRKEGTSVEEPQQESGGKAQIPRVEIAPQTERLSKYLSRTGITSRRGAKKLIEEGIV
jgi:hypothetical protein